MDARRQQAERNNRPTTKLRPAQQPNTRQPLSLEVRWVCHDDQNRNSGALKHRLRTALEQVQVQTAEGKTGVRFACSPLSQDSTLQASESAHHFPKSTQIGFVRTKGANEAESTSLLCSLDFGEDSKLISPDEQRCMDAHPKLEPSLITSKIWRSEHNSANSLH
jgi:hypothetical protein